MFFVFSLKSFLKKSVIYIVSGILIYTAFNFLTKKDTETAMADKKYYIAIIIDDFGYSGEGTDEVINLPIKFTGAVMPFSSSSSEDSEKLVKAGKDTIVHMPMESLTGKKSWVGDKGVFTNMSDEDIKSTVNEAFGIVNGAVGLNNHMGSAIMEDKRALSAVLDVVSEKGLLFVDSMTTPNSKAEELCNEKNIKLIKRDVFLDSTDDINKVKENLLKAEKVAQNKGYAVAIGHVGPDGGMVTVNGIKELYSDMEKRGVEFVTVSELGEIIGK